MRGVAIEHLADLPDFYQAKRDLFNHHLETSRFELIPSAGTFFQLVRYDAIRDVDDQEFVRWLTQDIGVAAIPMSVFYESPPDERYIRFCFCKEDATLIEAAGKLKVL